MKVVGAVAIIAGCGGFGFSMAWTAGRECTLLRCLIRAIQEMQWELKYRMTELPELCRLAGDRADGVLGELFEEIAGKLERREVMDVSAAFLSEINSREFPRYVQRNLKQLALCLGRYDLEGQLQGLEVVRQQCRKDLEILDSNRSDRMRSYQTLAVCAGAALSILFF